MTGSPDTDGDQAGGLFDAGPLSGEEMDHHAPALVALLKANQAGHGDEASRLLSRFDPRVMNTLMLRVVRASIEEQARSLGVSSSYLIEAMVDRARGGP